MQKAGPKKVLTAERRRMAVKLRTEGLTYEKIGEELGVTKVGAYKLVETALEEIREHTNEDAGRVRDLELQRLDELTKSLWPDRADPRVTDTILRVMDRRAKLLGLDAHERHEVKADAALDATIMAELSAFRTAGSARVISAKPLPLLEGTSVASDPGGAPALAPASGAADEGPGEHG